MSKIRKCICCNNSYEYCGNCGDGRSKPSWMAMYDTEKCKDVFNVVSGYNMGLKQKYEVKAVLDKYSIVDFSKFKDSIKTVLTNLFPPEEEPRKNKKRNNRVDIDFDDNAVAATEMVEEPVVIEEGIS